MTVYERARSQGALMIARKIERARAKVKPRLDIGEQ
jgi:hypothetical protein